MRLPVYRETKPHKGLLAYTRKWLRSKKIPVVCILSARPNLLAAVIKNPAGPSMICFYVENVCIFGKGNVIIYYDLEAMGKQHKESVEDTFTNWIAQSYLNE